MANRLSYMLLTSVRGGYNRLQNGSLLEIVFGSYFNWRFVGGFLKKKAVFSFILGGQPMPTKLPPKKDKDIALNPGCSSTGHYSLRS